MHLTLTDLSAGVKPEAAVFWYDCERPHLGVKLAKNEDFEALLDVMEELEGDEYVADLGLNGSCESFLDEEGVGSSFIPDLLDFVLPNFLTPRFLFFKCSASLK